MAYFDCQIVQGGGGVILTVTCDAVYAGTTITATDGETTLTATCPSSSPYTVEFKLPNSGSWTISGTASGDTQTTTVVIPDSAILEKPMPNGATVTPVDRIQTWLHCANVWDKTYTTISQVLSDTSLVTTLIASNNAVDYMARSTSWASSVTANSSAMTKIGANNYCANKLLANSTWLNAICNSTYFESVLNVKVPTMTSNTTPSGLAFGNDENANAPYLAFDSVSTTFWGNNSVAASTGNTNLGYKFTSAKKIYLVKITNRSTSPSYAIRNFKIQGSTNGTNYTTLYTGAMDSDSVNYSKKYTLSSVGDYTYYRIKIDDGYDAQYVRIAEAQFYGR